ncbi:XRE family transcriptional regulator [Streptomyces xanthii]|uniref:XRE family transcriptional regulator n=1 Tax=Streptomyces xanthii TaxID=2768069 RepID=A0A7H1B9U6_9ACTN|nr:XRE family transcriptional regulator [Streptomyces xanthii]QNS05501.1 XRE family transcriptional regulator [Streptomyces xanthii]
MEANGVLLDRMRELDLTQDELAEACNDAIESLTGARGAMSARTVYNLIYRTRWPRTKQRMALEIVLGRPAVELGFIPRTSPPVESEDPDVHRRAFGTLTASLALGAALPATAAASQHRVGASDVGRLHSKFAEIIAKDHRQGGRASIEHQALALAGEALGLVQSGSCSQRVKGMLFATAASFTSSAMWAAIDGRRFDAAQRHFDRATALAGMSGDQAIQFRIWSHAGSMYRHLGRPVDALAANDAARRLRITRTDPMFAALGHARHAAIHGVCRDPRAIERCMDLALDAYDRAEADAPRPLWLIAFFDRAEIHSLATAAHLAAHDYEAAEGHAHKSLALLRAPLTRSRAITTTRLARAQLGQGDIGPAVRTAMSMPDPQAAHPRVHGMLTTFGYTLERLAPGSSHARLWAGYAHDHHLEGPTR